MSWRTNPGALWARNFGRALGVNRIIGRLGTRGYEESYDRRLTECIQVGDVVWDIGANVGYYTRQFSARVGADGKIVAFEPSARNYARLQAACVQLSNVALQPYGLGNLNGKMHFKQGQDPLGATSQVVDDDGTESVDIRIGDQLIAAGDAPSPNIIKMDVEGFEWEVFEGLRACLNSPSLRAIGIEVHFGILQQRGLGRVPHALEMALTTAGFTIGWPDHSHMLAVR